MKLSSTITLAGLILAFASCTPNISVGEGNKDNYTIAPEGGSCVIDYEAKSSWSIINDQDWITLSEKKGAAGKVSIKVTATPNNGKEPRSASLFMLDGASNVKFTISQDCMDAIFLDRDTYYVPMEGTFSMTVGANVAYKVSSPDSWIQCPSTKSNPYSESVLEFTIEKNPSDKPRNGKVVFEAETCKKEVTFVQSGWVDVDWNAAFYKSVLGIRFTGTWCGWCPSMAYDVVEMEKQNPGRLTCICVYNGSGAELDCPYESELGRLYGIKGYPSMVLDARASFSNEGVGANLEIFKAFANEQISSYAPASAITADVFLNGNKIDVAATVFSKEEINYNLHVAILESGIVAAQHDYANLYSAEELANFVHNNVIKHYVTELNVGDECSLGTKSSRIFSYSLDVPSNVVNSSNVSVVLYTTRPVVDGPKNVGRLSYYSKNTEYIDNCIVCPVNSRVGLKYE